MIILESKPLTLLVAIVALLFISPFIEATPTGDFLLTLAFSAVLLSIVRMVWDRQLLQIGVGLLSCCAIFLLALGDPFPQNRLWLAGEAFYILLCIFIISYALVQIMMSEVVDRDVLVGAITIYLLIGVTWSLIYSLAFGLDPDSFGDLLSRDQAYWSEFVYFSFATLTTLGYGDIVAIGPVTRLLSVFEAIIGVVFEAMIIARLVGLYRGGRIRRDDEPVK
ncbi:MAG: potassium channel family protein [Hyphomicrobiaceae bacterium]